jgi:hypothetical protein
MTLPQNSPNYAVKAVVELAAERDALAEKVSEQNDLIGRLVAELPPRQDEPGLREALREARDRIDLYPTHDEGCPVPEWTPDKMTFPNGLLKFVVCQCSHAALLGHIDATLSPVRQPDEPCPRCGRAGARYSCPDCAEEFGERQERAGIDVERVTGELVDWSGGLCKTARAQGRHDRECPVDRARAALAAQPARQDELALCGDDSWDSRYTCVKPLGHPITGLGLTDHDYKPKSYRVRQERALTAGIDIERPSKHASRDFGACRHIISCTCNLAGHEWCCA